ncbi:hypothetical protein V8C86DRAFT_130695 [Haematococcus lacustris]
MQAREAMLVPQRSISAEILPGPTARECEKGVAVTSGLLPTVYLPSVESQQQQQNKQHEQQDEQHSAKLAMVSPASSESQAHCLLTNPYQHTCVMALASEQEQQGLLKSDHQDSAQPTPIHQQQQHQDLAGRFVGLWHTAVGQPTRWLWSNGLLCAVLCQLIFSLAILFVKLMDGRVPLLEFTAHRSLFSWLLTLFAAWRMGIKPVYGQRPHQPKLIFRGALQGAAMITYYYAAYLLPISEAVLASLLHPPLTALIAWPLLKDPLGWRGWLGCSLAFMGVTVLTRPAFLFPHHDEDGTGGAAAPGDSSRALGICVGLLSASLQACSNIYYKFVSKEEHALTVALWFHIVTLVVSIVPAGLGWPQDLMWPGWQDHLLLAGIAMCSFFGHLIMGRAFQLLPAATASMFAFTVVGWAYLFEITIFHDPFNLAGLLGTALISAGLAAVLWRDRDRQRQAAAANPPQIVLVAVSQPLKQEQQAS